jgi:hypothetical protein
MDLFACVEFQSQSAANFAAKQVPHLVELVGVWRSYVSGRLLLLASEFGRD